MSFDITMSNMGNQEDTFFLREKVQIWNTTRLNMQASGVSAIENMWMVMVVNMVCDTILLNLRNIVMENRIRKVSQMLLKNL